jgi:hypothetical protein
MQHSYFAIKSAAEISRRANGGCSCEEIESHTQQTLSRKQIRHSTYPTMSEALEMSCTAFEAAIWTSSIDRAKSSTVKAAPVQVELELAK